MRFHRSRRLLVPTTLRSSLVWGLRNFSPALPPTAVDLAGEWPICARCARQRRALRATAIGLVAGGAVPLAILLLGVFLRVYSPPQSALLGAAFFPVWFPGLVTLAGVAYARSERHVRVGPVREGGGITIHAHPAFAEAVDPEWSP